MIIKNLSHLWNWEVKSLTVSSLAKVYPTGILLTTWTQICTRYSLKHHYSSEILETAYITMQRRSVGEDVHSNSREYATLETEWGRAL